MIHEKSLYYFLGVVAIGLVFAVSQAGCTKNDEQQAGEIEEKGRIEQMTDETAEKAVRKIRTPIDKARNTQDLGDDRMESMDKALQQQ
ncbi:MAG: hypothetical protein ABFR35_02595 [Thermodesulfobacteriota bacterium]|jgi:hypothetical protein